MQDADEDGAFDGKIELAPLQEVAEEHVDAQAPPQPLEQERTADAYARQQTGFHVRQDAGASGMAGEGIDQPVEIAAFLQSVLAAQCADGALPDLIAFSNAFDEIEVGVAACGFFTNVHG